APRASNRPRSRPARGAHGRPPTARPGSRARTNPTEEGPRLRRTSTTDSLRQQRLELVLVEDGDLELLRLLQLRAGAQARDHVVGLGADAARRLPAELAHQGLGVGPAHRLERAREDERLAGQRPIADRL